ncbi:MAG: signal peptide peptidase SppA [Acidobacteria bacterium]|nr:signal peptide peptidase SppA [Acidobacteriota bacterium]
MKKWFWGLLTGVFLTMGLLAAFSFLGWYLESRPPELQPNSLLVLKLEGEIPEQIPPDIAGQLLGGKGPATFVSLLENIEKAAADSRIKGILLEPSNLQVGWAKLQQLRRSLEEFRSKGKRLVAWVDTAGSKEYYLASAADRVFLSPVGVLDLKGMRAEVMFFKDTLAKLGVQADMERIGEYKNLADQFTDNSMSDAFREATTSMLDSIYGDFLMGIASARRHSMEDMRKLIEESGPFEADRALPARLVDQLLYEDEVSDQMKKELGNQEVHEIPLDRYRRVPRSAVGLRGGERIALVYAVGDIVSGEDRVDPLSGKTMGEATMKEVLEEVGEDDSIKGVLVRIDSGGGDAFASENIWRNLLELRKKKQMVISMSDAAASGGYLIAMTGDPVVAESATLTGSIGIIYGKLNLKGFYDKIGVNKEIISRGKFATLDSDYGPYTPEQRQRVQALMEDFYRKFLAKVAAARKMTPEAVDQVARGRVWTGEQAHRQGLVDELGGLERALELLKEKAGLRPDARVEIVEYPKRKSLLELIFGRIQRRDAALPAGLARWLFEWQLLERLSQRPLWTRMPYVFEFR